MSRSLCAATILGVAVLATACRPTIVVLPANGPQVTRADTVVVRDTITVTDTLRRRPLPVRRAPPVRRDTVVVHDTVTIVRRDTVVVQDTVRRPIQVRPPIPSPRPDTARIRDALRPPARRDTVVVRDTVFRHDTVVVRDTVVRRDTVVVRPPRIAPPTPPGRGDLQRPDTSRVEAPPLLPPLGPPDPGRTVAPPPPPDTSRTAPPPPPGGGTESPPKATPRKLMVPPGHHPRAGQCRVWLEGVPPGRQAPARPCDQLGEIPAGAFILYGGDAWDFDFDWLGAEQGAPGSVPPVILGLTHPGKGQEKKDEDGKARGQQDDRRPGGRP